LSCKPKHFSNLLKRFNKKLQCFNNELQRFNDELKRFDLEPKRSGKIVHKWGIGKGSRKDAENAQNAKGGAWF
jgi:hypothetical protein